jgi:hypothetical protein
MMARHLLAAMGLMGCTVLVAYAVITLKRFTTLADEWVMPVYL